jgi:hypothetical protein
MSAIKIARGVSRLNEEMMRNIFDILILIGRPASGKSEIIDYLKRTAPDVRASRFHLAQLDVLDDFPMLWTWFEEDQLLADKFGQPRLFTTSAGYFKYPYLWDLLIERFNLEYQKRLRDHADYHAHTTLIVEFARGTEHGGYARAFSHLSDDILRRAGLVYVNVPFEESLRKNRRRFNPDRPDSILEHALPDDKLERLYRDDDWAAIGGEQPSILMLRSIQVPYAVFENADDVTTGRPEQLGNRLETVLGRLWELRSQ